MDLRMGERKREEKEGEREKEGKDKQRNGDKIKQLR